MTDTTFLPTTNNSTFQHLDKCKNVVNQKMLTSAFPWRTGGDHQDALVLCGWRLFSSMWNITSPWMKQSTCQWPVTLTTVRT